MCTLYVLRRFQWDFGFWDAFKRLASQLCGMVSRDLGRKTEILNQDHCKFDGIFHFRLYSGGRFKYGIFGPFHGIWIKGWQSLESVDSIAFQRIMDRRSSLYMYMDQCIFAAHLGGLDDVYG